MTRMVQEYYPADIIPVPDLAMNPVAGATVEHAAAKSTPNTKAPLETAAGGDIITKQTIKPLQSLTWIQLLRLIKAAHNPRFCGSLSVAQSNLADGTTGDFCAFMGGLSTVIRQALPNAPDLKPEYYIKYGLDPRRNASIDLAVETYLKAAFPPHAQAKVWCPPSSEAEKGLGRFADSS